MTDNVVPLYAALPPLPTASGAVLYNDPTVLARKGQHERLGEREQRRLGAAHRAVVQRCTGTLRAVAEMHAPRVYPDLYTPGDDPTCDGCDIDLDNMDAGAPPWPCSTFELIERNPA